jgi:hypothetical protein
MNADAQTLTWGANWRRPNLVLVYFATSFYSGDWAAWGSES